MKCYTQSLTIKQKQAFQMHTSQTTVTTLAQITTYPITVIAHDINNTITATFRLHEFLAAARIMPN